MKLFTSRRAPNPRRVRWCMAEKGIDDIELVDVDLFRGEHKTLEYRTRAGVPHVPALVLDDGSTLTESIAICRYLESLFPEPNLFGRDARETAIIEMWMRRAEAMIATPLMLGVRHGHPALAALQKQDPDFAAAQRAEAEKAMPVFDRQLGQGDFIVAGRLTIADIVAFSGIDFARLVQFRPDQSLEHLERWAQRMRQRPASAAGM